MDPLEAGRQAAEEALLRLGARTIATEKLPLVVENQVTSRLFQILLSPMNGWPCRERVLFSGERPEAL
jgi:predicted Zn-dependent protease